MVLLGRPGQYMAKVSFHDGRIAASGDTDFNTSNGGSVEVFTNASDAKARSDYIQGLVKAMPFLGVEYDYVVDKALLRVSNKLTLDQALEYAKAFQSMFR